MIGSMRRVASMLCLLSILSLSTTAVMAVSIHCGSGESCLASLVGITSSEDYIRNYESRLSIFNTTEHYVSGGVSFAEVNTVVQQVSIYLLLGALAMLLVLEIFELHYIKLLQKKIL